MNLDAFQSSYSLRSPLFYLTAPLSLCVKSKETLGVVLLLGSRERKIREERGEGRDRERWSARRRKRFM